MSKRVTVSIKGRGETDSPSVDDFLEQVRDVFDILEGVEQAIAEDGASAIDWRIVKAETKSPIVLEAEPFPRVYAVNIDRRADLVIRQTATGFQQLRTRGERPPYFTDRVLVKAERLFERVTNGLDTTVLEFGPELPAIEITAPVARAAVA